MSQDPEPGAKHPDEIAGMDDHMESPLEPSTPLEVIPPDSSQITLPSTEVPASPLEPNHSFRTQYDDEDDRMEDTVIPSSMTPPPSTQIEPPQNILVRRTISQSQQSNLVSPPATLNNHLPLREASSDYAVPNLRKIHDASADELRSMLQASIAEQQKLKTEAAHHKMQYSLLKIQTDEDANRAEVECEMLRREIEALRMTEQARQAKRELSTFSDALQTKFLDAKFLYEGALDEVDTLGRRLKVATKIIQEKDKELMNASDEKEQLLTRIRENRDHMKKLCSPGGIFHDALTPKQPSPTSPVLARGTPRQAARGEGGHLFNTLLEAASQDDTNNSSPSTPIQASRSIGRRGGGHHRNSQSMSALPTTPIRRRTTLLPSVSVVPQTEPQRRFAEPVTPTPKGKRRKSRESTISEDVDDTEELARQAFQSIQHSAQRSLATSNSQGHSYGDDSDVFGSQASQAATEMLRRDAKKSFESRSPSASQEGQGAAHNSTAAIQARLLTNLRSATDKRKFSGQHESMGDPQLAQGSPPKKSRVTGESPSRRFGLGIQYEL